MQKIASGLVSLSNDRHWNFVAAYLLFIAAIALIPVGPHRQYIVVGWLPVVPLIAFGVYLLYRRP